MLKWQVNCCVPVARQANPCWLLKVNKAAWFVFTLRDSVGNILPQISNVGKFQELQWFMRGRCKRKRSSYLEWYRQMMVCKVLAPAMAVNKSVATLFWSMMSSARTLAHSRPITARGEMACPDLRLSAKAWYHHARSLGKNSKARPLCVLALVLHPTSVWELV